MSSGPRREDAAAQPARAGALPRLSRAALEALAVKYAALERLRRQRDRDEPHPPREELRHLSRDFPGCLRELDRHTAEALAAKQADARAALQAAPLPTTITSEVAFTGDRGEGPPHELAASAAASEVVLPPERAWLAWIHRYHELVRDELMAGRPGREGARVRTLLDGSTARDTAAGGPSGRALDALAKETGETVDALREALFPPRRRPG